MNTQTITHSPIEIMDFLGMKMVKRPKTGFRPVTVSNRLRVNVSPDLMGQLKRLDLVTTLNRMTYAARDKREKLHASRPRTKLSLSIWTSRTKSKRHHHRASSGSQFKRHLSGGDAFPMGEVIND